MREGYLLCVFGKKLYFDLCLRLIKNIRCFDKEREICVLTSDTNYFANLTTEKVIPIHFDYNNHKHHNIDYKNHWNKYGFAPKIFQHLYTPFDITLFFDVDMIFYKDFTFMFDLFKKQNLPILTCGIADENNRSPSNWHWYCIDDVISRCGYNCPAIWSTAFVYDTSFKDIIHNQKLLNIFLDNIVNFHVRSYYNDGYPDEIIYSLILGYLNIRPNKEMSDWMYNSNNLDSFNKVI